MTNEQLILRNQYTIMRVLAMTVANETVYRRVLESSMVETEKQFDTFKISDRVKSVAKAMCKHHYEGRFGVGDARVEANAEKWLQFVPRVRELLDE